MSFKGKNVLITGASRGIGKSIAIDFSKAGAKVGINYINNDKTANETLSLLEGSGHQALKFDISDAGEAKKLVQKFVQTIGDIDILVNNAGISSFHTIDKVDFETWKDSWHRIIQTNLISAANLCYLVSKNMIKNGSGRIVNISSRGAFRGEPEMMAYGASKAGLNSLTQSLAKALGKFNIIVNAVAPGFTETEMGLGSITEEEKIKLLEDTPLRRMALPEEIAKAVLYLASEGSEYTTGTILDINGASYFR